jgi:2-methylcitrate dehydratase PrpD
VSAATSARPLARVLADWVASLGPGDLPADAQAATRLRVLDTVGLVVTGNATDAGRAIRAQALAAGGAPVCTLIGDGARLPAAQTALAHGVMAHCRDFDDTFVDSVVHPGSVVIPTALAVGEAVDASDDAFVTAVVAGYEVAARIGAVAGRRFHAHHLHATGVVGPIAAAVTAARLLGLDGERTAWAMGLAASMSGGLMAFVADGGWSKWLHAGWAAHGGVLAAELAARGFRGPEHVLDGGHDLYSALLHGETIDRASVVAELGDRWAGADCAFKYYPCAHVIQPYVDAVLDIVGTHDLRPADIARITCAIAPWAAAIVAEPRAAKLRFDTELEAIASLPYQVAVAVIERGVGLEALTAASRARGDYATLALRVEHRSEPALGRGFDGALELVTTAGVTHRRATGTAGVDRTKLVAKFVRLVGAERGTQAAEGHAERLLATDGWREAARILRG